VREEQAMIVRIAQFGYLMSHPRAEALPAEIGAGGESMVGMKRIPHRNLRSTDSRPGRTVAL
jgi:hypothetical protein